MGAGRSKSGLTVVELLVVIAIIAALAAILLPAVAALRNRANSVQCMANLRSAGQLMLAYAAENDGWLPGSPTTTGSQFWCMNSAGEYESAGLNPDDLPLPSIELFDWMGPLSDKNGALPKTGSGVERLRAYRQMKPFTCPSNDIIATRDGGVDVEDGPMLSYCTGLAFMLLPARIPAGENESLGGRVTMRTGGSKTDPAHFQYWSSPPDYLPKLDRIGPSGHKIFLADGARASRRGEAPQFTYRPEADITQTLFSDFGPFCGITRSYDRSAANHLSSARYDGRLFAYRHGTRRAGARSGEYRLNAVFYDGHVETLDDVGSARPEYWVPTGSMIYQNARFNDKDNTFWDDVWQEYLPQATPQTPYRVP